MADRRPNRSGTFRCLASSDGGFGIAMELHGLPIPLTPHPSPLTPSDN